ncbi:hypothetical protein [Sphingobium sp.]|uniref:hypothetical protein n=1 Tax=Sphingobium sp. TaxID=1912891 RepID=UPI003B3A7D4D
MFGIRFRSLFTSRWFALLWVVLVLLTAIQIVGPGDDSKDSDGKGERAGNAVAADGLTNDQRAAIMNAF